MPPPIPERVLEFLRGHVRTLEELHLLFALYHSGDRWWDATSAARELNLTVPQAGAALDHLAKHNLLDIRITGDVRYQFRPGNPALGDAVTACVDAYRRNPLALLQEVAGTGRRSIRDFADAFRIRSHDDR